MLIVSILKKTAMNTIISNQSLFISFGNFVSKIASAIVSGIPREKIYCKPVAKTTFHQRNQNLKADSEKHYHRPASKPVPEQQTLLKEIKKP